MLVIRLFRVGKNNQPFFKIVITDKKRSSTTGRFVEEVGCFNPLKKEKILKQERIKYWLSVGAKPSPTVFNLLVSEKIIEGKKIDVHKKAKEKKEPSVAKAMEGKEAASLPAEASAKAGAPATASQEATSAPVGATASQKEKPKTETPETPKEEAPSPVETPSAPEPPKEEPKPEVKQLKEDKSSFRPSPSGESSGKEETPVAEEKK